MKESDVGPIVNKIIEKQGGAKKTVIRIKIEILSE